LQYRKAYEICYKTHTILPTSPHSVVVVIVVIVVIVVVVAAAAAAAE